MKLKTAPAKCQQVADFITREIMDGNLRPGDRLYSMRDLCSKFGSSVAVINSASDILEKNGLVERMPRKGVFVAAGKNAKQRFVLLTNVGFKMTPHYHEELFKVMQENDCSIYPLVIDPKLDWCSMIDQVIRDEKPTALLIDLEARFFDIDLIRQHVGDYPHMFVGRYDWDRENAPTGVYVDFNSALETGLRHLLKKGHKRILYVGHDPEPTLIETEYGKEMARRCNLQYPGADFGYVYCWGFAVDFDATCDFLEKAQPTALISVTDEMIFGFLSMYRGFYPEEADKLEMIGGYDLIYSNIPGQEFSSFAIDYNKFWKKVIARFENGSQPVPGVEWMKPELILRKKKEFTRKRITK